MASPRQIAANQANAQKSTGPSTEAGKSASRANALKHGLAAETLMTEPERDAVEARMAECRGEYRLATRELQDAFMQMVLHSVRLEHCRAREATLRRIEMARAERRWDEDRHAAAEALLPGLARCPEVVAGQLKQTVQGIDWMIEAWGDLGRRLPDQQGEWTPEQTSTALDLMGMARVLRPSDPDFTDPAAVVAREVARLEGLKEGSLVMLDALERDAARAGTPATESAEMKQLRRYEATCLRNYHRALAQLREHRVTSPQPVPEPVPEPESKPGPGPSAPERTQCEVRQEGAALPVAAPFPGGDAAAQPARRCADRPEDPAIVANRARVGDSRAS